MEIWEDRQKNPVADDVSALVAVTGPIISGVLQSVPLDVTNRFGGRDQLPLKMLGRLRKLGKGDCGIAFEYAVHDAVVSHEPVVAERVAEALSKCGVRGTNPASIFFAVEKSGAQELISTEPGLVMDNSPVLLGGDGKTVSLREQLAAIGATFRRPGSFLNLAQSIRGLWKAELFLGGGNLDQWVSTRVYANPRDVRAVRGLQIAIVPNATGYPDVVKLDEQKNVVICPLPYDGSFIKVFYEGWRIVQALCARNFRAGDRFDAQDPVTREVTRMFVERREFPILDVVEAVRKFGQPELLTSTREVVSNVPFETTADLTTSTIITPIARMSTTTEPVHEALAHPIR
ncbi:MAG TPA: hypothetical protein VGS19_08665 [Streptosporangiaceae bacterium]|nr:hypothetical protein [Streptosporangiaceae bacterium]